MANICPKIKITTSQVEQVSQINRSRFDNKYYITKDDKIETSSPKIVKVYLTPTGSCVSTASNVKFAYKVEYSVIYDISSVIYKLPSDEIETYNEFDVGFIWLDENEIGKISRYDDVTNMKNYLEISKGGL